jgi:hypothetical protein
MSESINNLRFVHQNTTHNYIGKLYHYFYSGGYITTEKHTESNILEKLQFVYEIFFQSNSMVFSIKNYLKR